jgi:hypothetical protein
VAYFGLLCRLKGIDPDQLEQAEVQATTESINKAIETMFEQEHLENIKMAQAINTMSN